MIRSLFIILSITMSVAFQTVFAAQIKAVKGKKILIDMQSDSFKAGDILKIENSTGKAVGIAKITKVKGTLAEAVLKGKAEKGFKASLRPAKAKGGSKASTESSREPAKPSLTKTVWGGMVGYNMASADVKLANGTSVSLDGTGFSAKAFVDYPLFPWLVFRGLAGLEQFNVGGVSNTATDGCGGECMAEINYMSFGFWGKAHFIQGSFRPWAGLGFDVMFPISKDSTALDKESITNTSVIALGGGFDWIMSETAYIPIQVEYDMYPSSSQVEASSIAIRGGFGKMF